MIMSFYHSISFDYVGGVELKLYCDDNPTMWIDGVIYRGKSARGYLRATVSDDIKLLAVNCFDFLSFGGFVASVGYDGNVLISDGQWKCSDQLSEYERHHWYELDFDDSHWNHAYVINITQKARLEIHKRYFPYKAAWLWSDDDYYRKSGISSTSERSIYCRSPVLGR